MCGISGIIDFNNNSSVEILQSMNRTMVHRGPDGEGYSFDAVGNAQVGLGHRRLSIIDLSAGGTQPMHYLHYSILLNGEVYNYAEIKQELLALGHTFVSTSDTEVVLHAYIQWGKDCLEKLIGMFAIIIVNKQTKQVFGCRDRVGVKPFFYYWHNDLFLFSSELKAFHQHPKFIKQVNINAVATFLQYGYINAPHCIFDYCHKLLPGHYFTINLDTKQFTTHQYWNVYDQYNKPKLKIDFQEATDETEKILSKAFAYRMVADVPVGVFLSGGYDSTCVAALLQKNSTEKIKTYTIGVADTKLNEAPYAKQVAEILGTQHTEYMITEQDALGLIDSLPFYYDEPFADSSALPTMLVSKIARQDVTVALSADAGDEIFAGYNRYDYVTRYLGKLRKIPSPIRHAMAGTMRFISPDRIPVLNKDPLLKFRYHKIANLLKDTSVQALMKNMSSDINDQELLALVAKPFHHLQTSHISNQLQKEFFDEITYMMAIDYTTYLPDDIMQKVDRATMSVSLEGREPFLDQHVIEFAATLPTNFKYNNGNKKFILKEVVHRHIDKAIMERPKMGFAIPIAKWLQNDLKDIVAFHLSTEQVTKYGLLNNAEVLKYKQAFYAGKTELVPKMWYMLMLQMWCDKWL
jgi:asparagine synthase (glutamine-hydrolysing)